MKKMLIISTGIFLILVNQGFAKDINSYKGFGLKLRILNLTGYAYSTQTCQNSCSDRFIVCNNHVSNRAQEMFTRCQKNYDYDLNNCGDVYQEANESCQDADYNCKNDCGDDTECIDGCTEVYNACIRTNADEFQRCKNYAQAKNQRCCDDVVLFQQRGEADCSSDYSECLSNCQ